MVKTGLRFRRSDFETLLPRGQVGQFPDLFLGPRNRGNFFGMFSTKQKTPVLMNLWIAFFFWITSFWYVLHISKTFCWGANKCRAIAPSSFVLPAIGMDDRLSQRFCSGVLPMTGMDTVVLHVDEFCKNHHIVVSKDMKHCLMIIFIDGFCLPRWPESICGLPWIPCQWHLNVKFCRTCPATCAQTPWFPSDLLARQCLVACPRWGMLAVMPTPLNGLDVPWMHNLNSARMF